jgi:hypothetical protein
MAHPSAFALKNSGLNPFLFAEVGTESNGSALTILSLLARLGRDPWAEAARLAGLPRPVAIDCLAEDMAKMPLSPQDLADVQLTAARLALLLPRPSRGSGRRENAAVSTAAVPQWMLLTIFCCVFAISVVLHLVTTPRPAVTVAAPVEQTVGDTSGTK